MCSCIPTFPTPTLTTRPTLPPPSIPATMLSTIARQGLALAPQLRAASAGVRYMSLDGVKGFSEKEKVRPYPQGSGGTLMSPRPCLYGTAQNPMVLVSALRSRVAADSHVAA